MKALLFSILAAALAGCATSQDKLADDSAVAAERVCVSVHSINSFDAIDDRHVYIRATGNKHYLFTLFGGCYGLQGANTIAVKDTFSRVCSDGFVEIVYRERNRRLESCKIRDVEVVASKADAEGLVKDRNEARREARSEGES